MNMYSQKMSKYSLLYKLVFYLFSDQDQVDFDVEVAIKVCRHAGYFEHALELAKNHNYHDWYLQIQFSKQNYKDGLEYISDLDFKNAELNIKKYGTMLIKNLPSETTQLLKSLCTKNDGDKKQLANPDDFLQLFIR